MAKLSFKEFIDLEEKSKPSTICAAVRKLVGDVDCEDALDGIGPTPVSGIVMKAPGNPKTVLNIPIGTAEFDLSNDRRSSKMTVTPDEVTGSIYMNDDEDTAKNKFKKLTTMLKPVKSDELMTLGLLPNFRGGAAAGGASPGMGGNIV